MGFTTKNFSPKDSQLNAHNNIFHTSLFSQYNKFFRIISSRWPGTILKVIPRESASSQQNQFVKRLKIGQLQYHLSFIKSSKKGNWKQTFLEEKMATYRLLNKLHLLYKVKFKVIYYIKIQHYLQLLATVSCNFL